MSLKTAPTLSAIMSSNVFGSVSSIGARANAPATFTKKSGTRDSITNGRDRSTEGCPLRETASTCAPEARSNSTVAAPMPREAPVTSAVRPERLMLVVREPQEFIPRLPIVAETAAQGTGDRLGVLLLHPTHHHAQMLRLDDHTDTARTQFLFKRQSDLLGQPLLDLQAPGEHVDHARHFGESDDAPVRNVGHVRPAEEWQHMVLAQRVELDVPHHDHALVAGLLEERVADDLGRVHRVPTREKLQGLRDAHRRLHQPFAIRILAQQLELTADEGG